MTMNSGAKDHNDSSVSNADMRHETTDLVPEISSQKASGGLRGMEANVAESKGSPCRVPPSTQGSHEGGAGPMGSGTLEESY